MLKFGSVGEDVKELQTKLEQWGYHPGVADGIYGLATERSVLQFQKDQKLVVDGIAGYQTINKLKSEKFVKYVVRPGDNLSGIASKFDTTVWKIKVNNNLASDRIYVGEKLNIPQSGPKATARYVTGASSYTRINATQGEINLLARAIHSEARGESYEGKVAVGAVILNRVEHSRFPDTIREVIFEPWAFTAVHDGQFWLQPNAEALRAAHDALKGWDPSYGATFYYNPAKVTSHWIYSRPVITRIGRHYFAS